jgi:hypothetical protein
MMQLVFDCFVDFQDQLAVQIGSQDVGMNIAFPTDRRRVSEPCRDTFKGRAEIALGFRGTVKALYSFNAMAASTVAAQVRKSFAVMSLQVISRSASECAESHLANPARNGGSINRRGPL